MRLLEPQFRDSTAKGSVRDLDEPSFGRNRFEQRVDDVVGPGAVGGLITNNHQQPFGPGEGHVASTLVSQEPDIASPIAAGERVDDHFSLGALDRVDRRHLLAEVESCPQHRRVLAEKPDHLGLLFVRADHPDVARPHVHP